VNRIGAVSPAARPTPRMAPVRMPGVACGSTTFVIVCHLVAPRARLAWRRLSGTVFRASSAVVIITGRMSSPRVRDPASIDDPNCSARTKRPRPKRP